MAFSEFSITLDGSVAQINAAKEMLEKTREAYEGTMPEIPLVAVVKNERIGRKK